MSDFLTNLEKRMLSGFDGLDKQLFNLKDVMRRDLQVKNQRLHMKRNCFENKDISLEIDGNHLKQYRERNNLEISMILKPLKFRY